MRPALADDDRPARRLVSVRNRYSKAAVIETTPSRSREHVNSTSRRFCQPSRVLTRSTSPMS